MAPPPPVSLPLTLCLPSLLFPTEILITQNPPKLRKVSLKVLDRVGRKGEISGAAGAQMKTFLRILHETAKMSNNIWLSKEKKLLNAFMLNFFPRGFIFTIGSIPCLNCTR